MNVRELEYEQRYSEEPNALSCDFDEFEWRCSPYRSTNEFVALLWYFPNKNPLRIVDYELESKLHFELTTINIRYVIIQPKEL